MATKEQGSPDTPLQVRAKLVEVDGPILTPTYRRFYIGSILMCDRADTAQGEIRFLKRDSPLGPAATPQAASVGSIMRSVVVMQHARVVSLEDGEDTALRIGVANDPNDNIELYAPSEIYLNGPDGRDLGFRWRATHVVAITITRALSGSAMALAITPRCKFKWVMTITITCSAGFRRRRCVGVRVNGQTVPLNDAGFRPVSAPLMSKASALSPMSLMAADSEQFLRSDRNVTLGAA